MRVCFTLTPVQVLCRCSLCGAIRPVSDFLFVVARPVLWVSKESRKEQQCMCIHSVDVQECCLTIFYVFGFSRTYQHAYDSITWILQAGSTENLICIGSICYVVSVLVLCAI